MLRIDNSTRQIIELSCETGYTQNVDWGLWKNYTSSTRYSCNFTELSRHIHFNGLMPFASNCSNFFICDFSDLTNKHIAPVTDVKIRAIVTDYCRIICAIMKPVS